MQFSIQRGCPARSWREGSHLGYTQEPLRHESEGSWLVMCSTPELALGRSGPGGLLRIHRCRHCECLFTEDPPQIEKDL